MAAQSSAESERGLRFFCYKQGMTQRVTVHASPGRSWRATPGTQGINPAGRRNKHKKKASSPISRVLSWTVIHLGPASPRASSNLPESSAGHAIGLLFGLAPGGVYHRRELLPVTRCALTAPFHPYRRPKALRRYTFCCTFRRLAPPRRYLAPCPVEPGLSSPG